MILTCCFHLDCWLVTLFSTLLRGTFTLTIGKLCCELPPPSICIDELSSWKLDRSICVLKKLSTKMNYCEILRKFNKAKNINFLYTGTTNKYILNLWTLITKNNWWECMQRKCLWLFQSSWLYIKMSVMGY